MQQFMARVRARARGFFLPRSSAFVVASFPRRAALAGEGAARFGAVAPKLLTSLFGVAACFAMLAQPTFAADGASPEPGPPAAPAANAAQSSPAPEAGMKIYVDPRTGAILSEPAPGTAPLELSPAERNAFSTSSEGLVQVPNLVPGGGIKLDLQGRFQSPIVGTAGSGGIKTQNVGEPTRGTPTTPEGGRQ